MVHPLPSPRTSDLWRIHIDFLVFFWTFVINEVIVGRFLQNNSKICGLQHQEIAFKIKLNIDISIYKIKNYCMFERKEEQLCQM